MIAAQRPHVALLASTFAIAVCGLVYELLAGTVSSYLLGDSIYQFSLVIGLFMAAMGLGAYLSRFIADRVVETFVAVQLVVGLLGGTSALVLFLAFSHLSAYEPMLVLVSVGIGALVGLEIPLVVRLLRTYQVLKLSVSNVLTADYVGALLASLLFPIVLVPSLGLVRTGLLFGLLNVFVAGVALYTFRAGIRRPGLLFAAAVAAGAVLLAFFASAGRLTGVVESRLYSGEVIFSETTPYQQIVLTRDRSALSLFINGALQFSSLDEYRYHEALVHPAMTLAVRRGQVLILGGGDGLALREVLKHPDVERVTLVDIDPAVTTLFSSNPLLRRLNADALLDPRVDIVNADAAKFLEASDAVYDVVIADLPDPSDVPVSRLYTGWFYRMVAARLAASGILVTQATSPLYAREAFWAIERTIAEVPVPRLPRATLRTAPYHVYVPTFGEWGFVLASARTLDLARAKIEVPTRFLDGAALATMGQFPPDMDRVDTEVNTLVGHALVGYYDKGWSRWYR